MQLNIIPIGNSKGIRIPKAILNQCHIKNRVDLQVKGQQIVICPPQQKPREGWNNAFANMFSHQDDILFIDDTLELINEDWQW